MIDWESLLSPPAATASPAVANMLADPATSRINHEFQTERSRLFLNNPAAFFSGWHYIDGAWVAPWAPRP